MDWPTIYNVCLFLVLLGRDKWRKVAIIRYIRGAEG